MIYFSHDLIMRRFFRLQPLFCSPCVDAGHKKTGRCFSYTSVQKIQQTVTFLKMRPHSLHTALQLAYATTLLSALASGQGLC